MPDVHAGKGCTIGTTMTLKDKVVPGMVGVDIGCGMKTIRIAEKDIDFAKLDKLIRSHIPSGRAIHSFPHPLGKEINLSELICAPFIDIARAERSIGSLGGGNHFIEIDKGSDGAYYLVIHSGSRHLSLETAKHYQNAGYKAICDHIQKEEMQLIAELRAAGKPHAIQTALEEFRKETIAYTTMPRDLAYVEGQLFDDYIHDMKVVQKFAMLNRKAMVQIIVDGMGWTEVEHFTTIHNYIDTDTMILRKGAVSAKQGEKLLIPINMRDGSLICIGKGNEEWNFSAPHGAGRLMSRTEALKKLSLEEYHAEMEGIFSTCVSNHTLDEAPMAYKDMSEIIAQIGATADIIDIIKPVYNYKAAE